MPHATRLLVVDDDPSIREMLRDYLTLHGYAVSEASSGEQMRAELERALPDIALVDVRLQGEDGLSLVRYVRERFDIGIIMVTAFGDVVDRVVGLEVGADDYVSKPFDVRELLARLKSLQRRLQARPEATQGASGSRAEQIPVRQPFGLCKVDLQSRRLFDRNGEEIPLTSMEFELLKLFLSSPNRVLSRDQLLMSTRNREWDPMDRSIDIRIGRLRRKIEPDSVHEPRFIRTVRSVGYMYVPEGQ